LQLVGKPQVLPRSGEEIAQCGGARDRELGVRIEREGALECDDGTGLVACAEL
jgi:hypothetical protein